MAYGACTSASDRTSKRITYVIGPDGKISQAIGSVDARTHPATLIDTL